MNSQLTIALIGGVFLLLAAIITGACTMLTPLVVTNPALAFGGAVFTILVCIMLLLVLALVLSLMKSGS
jgi:hypothetical protein